MLEKLDISMVLEHYNMDLHRASDKGITAHLRCPFHGADRNGSASVNLEEGWFFCFACDMRGDGWAIIRLREGIEDWGDTFQFARDHFGYEGSKVRGVAKEAFDPISYMEGMR